jgi:hypothetical protein
VSMSAIEPAHDLRGLLQIAPFRKLWTALGLASLGDWLGMFAAAAQTCSETSTATVFGSNALKRCATSPG